MLAENIPYKKNYGYVKFMRNYDESIHKYPYAFNLLAIIAQRARYRRRFDNLNLVEGEALIGDYKTYGLTRQKYRSTLKYLKSTNLITTRITNRGTIVKLVNSDIFDINISFNNQQTNQQTNHLKSNNQPLTNKDKKVNKYPDLDKDIKNGGFYEN